MRQSPYQFIAMPNEVSMPDTFEKEKITLEYSLDSDRGEGKF